MTCIAWTVHTGSVSSLSCVVGKGVETVSRQPILVCVRYCGWWLSSVSDWDLRRINIDTYLVLLCSVMDALAVKSNLVHCFEHYGGL